MTSKKPKFKQIKVWIAICPVCKGYYADNDNLYSCMETKKGLKELIDDEELTCDCDD